MRFSSTALAVVCAASSGGLERVDAQCSIGGSPAPAPLVTGTSLTCPVASPTPPCQSQTITGCTEVTCIGQFACAFTTIQDAITVVCNSPSALDNPVCVQLEVTNTVPEFTTVNCNGFMACVDDQAGTYGTIGARLKRVYCNGEQACGTITIFAREVFCENPGTTQEACFGTSLPTPNPIEITADCLACGPPSPPPQNIPACSAGTLCNFNGPGAPAAVPCTAATPTCFSSVPTGVPSRAPSSDPSLSPSRAPSRDPSLSQMPSLAPSNVPSNDPSHDPSQSQIPSVTRSNMPSFAPSNVPSNDPSHGPSQSQMPSDTRSNMPSFAPSNEPSNDPSRHPSQSQIPSVTRSNMPSFAPSNMPSNDPSRGPSQSQMPSVTHSNMPSNNPTTLDLCSPQSSADICPSGKIGMYHTFFGAFCKDKCIVEKNVDFWKNFGYACGSCPGA